MNGVFCIAGLKPALLGSNTSDPYLRAKASAIGERQMLPMQRKRIFFFI